MIIDKQEIDYAKELEYRITLLWLQKYVDALPERERKVLYLRRVAEYSYVDIARLLGVSATRVRAIERDACARIEDSIWRFYRMTYEKKIDNGSFL